MNKKDRAKLRAKYKASKRQFLFRSKQRNNGLINIYVKISFISHSLAMDFAKKNSKKLNQIITEAIGTTSIDSLPALPIMPPSSAHAGIVGVNCWIEEKTAQKLSDIAKNYFSKSEALDALIFNYCR